MNPQTTLIVPFPLQIGSNLLGVVSIVYVNINNEKERSCIYEITPFDERLIVE